LLSSTIVGQQVNTTIMSQSSGLILGADQRNWGLTVTGSTSQIFRFIIAAGQGRCILNIGVRAVQGSLNLYNLGGLFNGTVQLSVSQMTPDPPRSYFIGYTDYSNLYRLTSVNYTSSCVPLTGNTKIFILAERGAGNIAQLRVLQDGTLNLLTSVEYNWQDPVTNVTSGAASFTFTLSGGCVIVATVNTVSGSANLYSLDRIFDGETSLVISPPSNAPSAAPSTTAAPSTRNNLAGSASTAGFSAFICIASAILVSLF
jgi:hypothetical protein